LKNLKLVDPVGYFDFLNLMEHSQLVLTDSGGIQEETTYLGIPCLTVRENTERPITVEIGTNQLCGLDVDRIIRASFEVFDGKTKHGSIPEFWDGNTAERIAAILNDTI
ncbi:MAG: UDP-N-acetylglucosamine 2-epimerase, partial [Ignavibacteriales bacterium]|nr:UDP-N-acetylglucosamine 2-epimerase [Ignavibacteriales bacterium]